MLTNMTIVSYIKSDKSQHCAMYLISLLCEIIIETIYTSWIKLLCGVIIDITTV